MENVAVSPLRRAMRIYIGFEHYQNSIITLNANNDFTARQKSSVLTFLLIKTCPHQLLLTCKLPASSPFPEPSVLIMDVFTTSCMHNTVLLHLLRPRSSSRQCHTSKPATTSSYRSRLFPPTSLNPTDHRASHEFHPRILFLLQLSKPFWNQSAHQMHRCAHTPVPEARSVT